jgi:hypothetical protein
MSSQDMTVVASTDLKALRTAVYRIGTALRTMKKDDTDEILRSVLLDAALRDQDAALDVFESIDGSKLSAAA